MIERRRYLALPCDCAGSCSVLLVSEGWIEDDPRQFSLDLHEHVRAQGRWRDRLRVAWAVLRGGEPYTHGLVLYSKKAAELRDFRLRLMRDETLFDADEWGGCACFTPDDYEPETMVA